MINKKTTQELLKQAAAKWRNLEPHLLQQTFDSSLKRLYKEGIFGAGSSYINLGGLRNFSHALRERDASFKTLASAVNSPHYTQQLRENAAENNLGTIGNWAKKRDTYKSDNAIEYINKKIRYGIDGLEDDLYQAFRTTGVVPGGPIDLKRAELKNIQERFKDTKETVKKILKEDPSFPTKGLRGLDEKHALSLHTVAELRNRFPNLKKYKTFTDLNDDLRLIYPVDTDATIPNYLGKNNKFAKFVSQHGPGVAQKSIEVFHKLRGSNNPEPFVPSKKHVDLVNEMATYGIPFEEVTSRNAKDRNLIPDLKKLIEQRKSETATNKFKRDYPKYIDKINETDIPLPGNMNIVKGKRLSELSGSTCWGNVCISSPQHRYTRASLKGTHDIIEFKNPTNDKNRALLYVNKKTKQVEEYRGPNNADVEHTPEFLQAIKENNLKL